MLKADMDQLKVLAGVVEGVGTEIDAIEIRTAIDKIRGALVGCDLVTVCEQTGEFIEGAYLRVAERQRTIAAKTRVCASNFTLTDEQFKAELDKFDFHASGAH